MDNVEGTMRGRKEERQCFEGKDTLLITGGLRRVLSEISMFMAMAGLMRHKRHHRLIVLLRCWPSFLRASGRMFAEAIWPRLDNLATN